MSDTNSNTRSFVTYLEILVALKRAEEEGKYIRWHSPVQCLMYFMGKQGEFYSEVNSKLIRKGRYFNEFELKSKFSLSDGPASLIRKKIKENRDEVLAFLQEQHEIMDI